MRTLLPVSLASILALGICLGPVWLSSYARITGAQNGAGMSQAAPLPSSSPTAEQLARARDLFEDKCTRCHGPDGRSDTVLGNMLGAPNFTKAAFWTEQLTDEQLTDAVTNGKKEMPAFGKKLTPREIALLINYVRRFGKAPNRAQGK
jgi:mono/diheme cytochrome c family protein